MLRHRMRFFLGCIVASVVATLGCGGNDGKNPEPPPVPVSDVKGSIIDTHVTETGDVSSTRGPTNFEIAAIVKNLDGTPSEIFAVINADGTFVIPKVPEGPYDLRFVEFVNAGALPARYVMNAPRDIDLGRVYVGRPDATGITIKPTNLSLTAMGMRPWVDGDVLDMFSLGSGAAGALVPTNGIYPKADDTALTNYRVDTSQLLNPKLVEGGKGDTALLTQLAGVADPLLAPYQSVRKVFKPSSFTQMDGAPTDLSGMFADAPAKVWSANIDITAFNDLKSAVHKDATVAGKNARIIAEPGGTRASTSITPNLLICEALLISTFPTSFSYGNPFPSDWAEVGTLDVSYAVEHVAPTGISKSTVITIGQSGPIDTLVSPAKPLLSPPLDIKVNGMPAQDTLTGIGFSPTITFTPPAIGTPAVYIIAIRKLDPGGGTTRTEAIFSTTDTTLQIPEGVLDFGYYYYFRVSVRAAFDINHPFKSGTTNAYASALTGVVTP